VSKRVRVLHLICNLMGTLMNNNQLFIQYIHTKKQVATYDQ